MGPSERLPVRLTGIRYGARDITLYELEPLDARPLPAVQAGAHLDIGLPGGMVRQYSLVTPLCSPRGYVVAVKREEQGRGGSKWLHDTARVGQVLEVGTPRNVFALQPEPAPVLLLAGGIGITPIYSMYEELEQGGREVQLHYWCKSADQALFHDRLAGRGNVHLHYSQGMSRTGLAEVLAASEHLADIYCCGPRGMLDELDRLACARDRRLFTERFQASGVADDGNSSGFTVVLARSGSDLEVPPGSSILDVLRDAGVDVMYSCEQGICGACEVRVLAGAPVHADSVCSAEEHERRGTMMICCSSSKSSRLVLDL